MASPEVTLCIPTWKAEEFIGRTLACATAQTYARIRILVSVDVCEDRTEEICRQLARHDGRIEVFTQAERLGWSRNANFLLDRVETELFFLYFHDDIIEPAYTAELRQALLDRPDAMSAHCDLERFGDKSAIKAGYDYRGSDSRRLINFLVGPVKGAPLRSLTRSKLLAKGLRFPLIGTDGFWRCHPFLLQLLAAGPAVHVAKVLYRQWFRPGSVTTKWAPKTPDELLEGQRQSAALGLEIIGATHASDEEKDAVRFCLYLFIMTHTRQHELALQSRRLIEPHALSPAFSDSGLPGSVHKLGVEVQQWIRNAYAELLFVEAEHALLQRDYGTGRSRLTNAISLRPELGKKRLTSLICRLGIDRSALAIPPVRIENSTSSPAAS